MRYADRSAGGQKLRKYGIEDQEGEKGAVPRIGYEAE